MAIDRGNTVFFKNISFTDEDGDTVVASAATLTLSYPNGTRFTEATVTLTIDGNNEWNGSWDSSVSDAGFVYGTVEGTATNGDGDAITCVKDFKFKLVANQANEDAND